MKNRLMNSRKKERSCYLFFLTVFNLIFFTLMMISCNQGEDKSNAPTGLTVNAISPNSVDVSWDGVPNAVYYTVKYYMENFPNLSKVETDLTSNSCKIRGLKDDTTYCFIVKAAFDEKYNDTTDWSSPVKIKMPKDTSPTPGKLSYSNLTSSSVTLSWAGDSVATGYYIQYNDTIGGNGGKIECGKKTTCTISNLSPALQYTIGLRGYRSDGMIIIYDNISIFTNAGTTPLSKPTIRASVGGNKITVSWNAISGATKYYIKIYNSSFTLIGTYEAKSTTTSYTFTGLKSGAKYSFQMWAYNGKVYSSQSNLISATSM